MNTSNSLAVLAVFVLAAFSPLRTAAQDSVQPAGTPLPEAPDPSRAVAIVGNYCAKCHGWASSYEGIAAGGYVAPENPEESRLLKVIRTGYMPPSPPEPSPPEVEVLRVWIAAGAPAPEGADATSSATAPGEEGGRKDSGFLGFPSKAAYHRAAGWTSAGLLLAAGVVGVVRAYDLMSAGHDYRDSIGMTDEDQIDQQCYDEIASLWSDNQALRWTHISLLAAGETLYLGNAITGMSMAQKRQPGTLSKSDLHRYAFFAHAGLMATEIILGFFTTDALASGDHELVRTLGVAHAAVGITIPLVMIGSGIIIDM